MPLGIGLGLVEPGCLDGQLGQAFGRLRGLALASIMLFQQLRGLRICVGLQCPLVGLQINGPSPRQRLLCMAQRREAGLTIVGEMDAGLDGAPEPVEHLEREAQVDGPLGDDLRVEAPVLLAPEGLAELVQVVGRLSD